MIKTQPTEQLLTVREAAKALRVHEMTIKRWINGGVMAAIRLPGAGRSRWRIKASTVAAILNEGE